MLPKLPIPHEPPQALAPAQLFPAAEPLPRRVRAGSRSLAVIIPTHNRCDVLHDALRQLFPACAEVDAEVIVVDNCCTDGTIAMLRMLQGQQLQLGEQGVRLVVLSEPRRSASAARNAGAAQSQADVLVFMDDDVFVEPHALVAIRDTFDQRSDCGLVSANVRPRFESAPPAWALACQQSFNGWSLNHAGAFPALARGFQEFTWAVGSMLAVSRTAFSIIGGYPDDAVMVETRRGSKQYFRLIAGVGDSGMSSLVRQRGFKIYFNPLAACEHMVFDSRMTPRFWRTRLIEEAHYIAVTARAYWRKSFVDLRLMRKRALVQLAAVLAEFSSPVDGALAGAGSSSVLPQEMWACYHTTLVELDSLMMRYPGLADSLVRMVREGISEGDDPMARLPVEYQQLVHELLIQGPPRLLDAAGCTAFVARMPSSLQEETCAYQQMLQMLDARSPIGDPRAKDLLCQDSLQPQAISALQELLQTPDAPTEARKLLAFLQIKAGDLSSAVANLQVVANRLPKDEEIVCMHNELRSRTAT